MTRMTGSDCAVMCNLINTHTHTRSIVPSLYKTNACRFPLWHKYTITRNVVENHNIKSKNKHGTISSPFQRVIIQTDNKFSI